MRTEKHTWRKASNHMKLHPLRLSTYYALIWIWNRGLFGTPCRTFTCDSLAQKKNMMPGSWLASPMLNALPTELRGQFDLMGAPQLNLIATNSVTQRLERIPLRKSARWTKRNFRYFECFFYFLNIWRRLRIEQVVHLVILGPFCPPCTNLLPAL